MGEKVSRIAAELARYADPEKARVLSGFFKTGKGEYGEGDVFIGVKVPESRRVARMFRDADLAAVKQLLGSEIHEHRLTGFLILVDKFNAGDERAKRAIYAFYMENRGRANNWDLVDLSADKIVGEYLLERDKDVLYRFAKSEDVWERRIAIVSTFAFIKKGRFGDTLKIAEMLLRDKHDLIHKAAGWMLREVGKRGGLGKEKKFLDKYCRKMPRTMLRYAIERFPERERKKYLG
ncbi:MAG TPA: DNA alkylation repair protein [Candidatus Bilamarchaeum sp.]|nr:DNA alkylation repair protein [Candidatus Bilamarchaeum sp.]